MTAYSTTKAALIGMSGSIALDYGKYHIRSNVICPGATRTEMLETAQAGLAAAQNTDTQGALDILTRFLPLARVGETDEMAKAALFLASDDASYITGAVLPVEGGASIVDPCGVALRDYGQSEWGG
jgi:NAD(P)-dependent dehydrogenase (short-subunit alcohol dehydrogenase family)